MYKRNQRLPSGDDHPLLGQEQIKNLDDDIVFAKRKRNFRIKHTLACVVVSFMIIISVIFLHGIKSYRDIEGSSSGDKYLENETVMEGLQDSQTVASVIESVFVSSDKVETNPPLTIDRLYQFDYSLVPEGENAIIPADLSLFRNGVSYIKNLTGLNPDTEKLLSTNYNEEKYELLSASDKKLPRVLILHTQGTEGYSPEGAVSYSKDNIESLRTNNTEKNVVSLGEIMATELNKYGIPTLHCNILHDSMQYFGSYERSKETIMKYLAEYPSIQLVIDLQRDSIVSDNGDMIRPVTLIDGEAVAQIMCIIGSSWGGEECPNWMENLSLALKLREKLNSECVNICRPCELRESTYNQEIAPRSLLIEIGSSGNSIEEAERAVVILSKKIAELISVK